MTVRRDLPVVLGLWLLTAMGQASVTAVTEVKVEGGRIRIRATAATISEILDRLSRATGMKVVYDGANPTERLTATIDASSETEALSRLLEGLGLTYAFQLDAGGRHVETLFVTNSSSRTAARAASSSRRAPAFDEPVELEIGPAEDPTDDPAAMVPEGMAMNSVSPGNAGGPEVGGQGAVPGVDEPAFPSAASFPSLSNPPASPGFPNPGIPSYPTFPDPASYP